MKGEGLLLNGVCLVMALLFLGLAGLNFFSAGNFISTDSLFFTSVCGLMALLFLLVPLANMRAAKKAAQSPESGSAAALPGRASAAALRPGTGVTAAQMMKDAKGRPMPPDVARMVEQMKDKKT